MLRIILFETKKWILGKACERYTADQVGEFTVYNIGGSKYRLIAVIHFNRGKLFVGHVLTHAEYDDSSRALYGNREDRYLELVRRFPLRPLRTAADLDAAIVVIDSSIDRGNLSAPEQDYLDVLSDIVEAYENDVVPIAPVADAEMLRFQISKLARYFHVEPGAFLAVE